LSARTSHNEGDRLVSDILGRIDIGRKHHDHRIASGCPQHIDGPPHQGSAAHAQELLRMAEAGSLAAAGGGDDRSGRLWRLDRDLAEHLVE
jgi:hypothetical protein